MQSKQLCLCRGNGKVFILFEVSCLHDGSTLSVSADTVNGCDIPSGLYQFAANPEKSNLYVAVVPMLTISKCVLRLVERDASGTTISESAHALVFSTAKWSSRLNYRLKGHLSRQIRDYDMVAQYDRITIRVEDAIIDGDETILRFLAKLPYRKDNDLRVRCLLPNLTELPINPVVTDNSTSPLDFSPSKLRRTVGISIRVPREFPRLIFILEDLNHPSFATFDVLDGPVYRKICETTRGRLTPISSKPNGYQRWAEKYFADEATISKQRSIIFDNAPLFSIVVPLYRTPLALFSQMIDSVMRQSYASWELILVNASPEDSRLGLSITRAIEQERRIKAVTLEGNFGISGNTNRGIAAASGDFVCFLDHDDTLEPDALFEYAQSVIQNPETDVIYSDEDKLSPDGVYLNPFFKPDFSIDLIRNVNYICHFLAIRRSLLLTLQPSGPEVEGAQDHDLTLKAIEQARHVHHVARVLYHWRMAEGSTALDPSSKDYALKAGVNAVQAHLNRLGIAAEVSAARLPFTYKVRYALPEPRPLVSIIIPNKDHAEILRTCLSAIVDKSTYDNYEIVIVENNSIDPETFTYYEEIQRAHPGKVRVVRWTFAFNFSKLVNFGVSHAKGDYLLLLNNDTEVITPSWIEEMLGICAREDVGIVGARLLYPDNTIQHAGIMVRGFGAAHLCKDYPISNPGYYGLIDRTQDLSAVTAACLMTKRDVFDQVKGFTEEFAVAFNDVDFCLKVREIGKLVVYTPEAELYHYESVSRGYEDSPEKKLRFYREIALLNYRWVNYKVFGDPYINQNIIEDNPYFQVW